MNELINGMWKPGLALIRALGLPAKLALLGVLFCAGAVSTALALSVWPSGPEHAVALARGISELQSTQSSMEAALRSYALLSKTSLFVLHG